MQFNLYVEDQGDATVKEVITSIGRQTITDEYGQCFLFYQWITEVLPAIAKLWIARVVLENDLIGYNLGNGICDRDGVWSSVEFGVITDGVLGSRIRIEGGDLESVKNRYQAIVNGEAEFTTNLTPPDKFKASVGNDGGSPIKFATERLAPAATNLGLD